MAEEIHLQNGLLDRHRFKDKLFGSYYFMDRFLLDLLFILGGYQLLVYLTTALAQAAV